MTIEMRKLNNDYRKEKEGEFVNNYRKERG